MNKNDFKKLFLIIISSLVFGVIVVPFVIIVLFSFDSPFILNGIWDPADALGYAAGLMAFIGTITLGFISYKQTKAANNMAACSKEVSIQANELHLLSRLIDFERSNFEDLKHYSDEFCNLCSPLMVLKLQVNLCDLINNNQDYSSVFLDLLSYREQIRFAFEGMIRIMRQDKIIRFDNSDEVNIVAAKLFVFTYDYIQFLMSNEFTSNPYFASAEDERVSRFEECFHSFYSLKEKYIIKREEFLKKLICNKISFDEAKEFYSFVDEHIQASSNCASTSQAKSKRTEPEI